MGKGKVAPSIPPSSFTNGTPSSPHSVVCLLHLLILWTVPSPGALEFLPIAPVFCGHAPIQALLCPRPAITLLKPSLGPLLNMAPRGCLGTERLSGRWVLTAIGNKFSKDLKVTPVDSSMKLPVSALSS